VKAGPEADRVLLEHMRDCLGRILDYTNGERSRFEASRLVQDAVIRNLQTLAESSSAHRYTWCGPARLFWPMLKERHDNVLPDEARNRPPFVEGGSVERSAHRAQPVWATGFRVPMTASR
jgi:hypothetical protein